MIRLLSEAPEWGGDGGQVAYGTVGYANGVGNLCDILINYNHVAFLCFLGHHFKTEHGVAAQERAAYGNEEN